MTARYTLIVGTHTAEFGTETIAWFCPRCDAELRSVTFDLRRFGLEQFWAFALAQARAFNAREQTRTCASCGSKTSGGKSPLEQNSSSGFAGRALSAPRHSR